MKLTGELIENFAGVFLSSRYDDPRPTPPFHRQVWDLYASDFTNCGCVAPRDHAKSTALTYDYILASVLFRDSDYVILISSTEEKAVEQLSNISEELHINEDLQREFEIEGFETDQKTEIIAKMKDGHRFRILARGAEQKIRGAMWNGKRPNLIVCDDMEDDEQVESKLRREKFRRWFFRAAKQALSQKGKIRVHGTILHDDSLLSRLLKNAAWHFLFFKAHESYNDFSNILWPERWSENLLKSKRLELEQDGDSAGYSQEYLNDPLDTDDAFLRKEQFLPMKEDDYDSPKMYYLACDLAVSKQQRSDFTSFTVGGRDEHNIVHVVDEILGRWDPLEWITELFLCCKNWGPEIVFIERGAIWNSVWPTIRNEMNGALRSPSLMEVIGEDDFFINFEPMSPVKDKATRGRSLQRRMKAGMMRFDKQGSWYAGYEDELLRFTGSGAARHDDQFDSTAWLSIGIDSLPEMAAEDMDEPNIVELEEWEYLRKHSLEGLRNASTGY